MSSSRHAIWKSNSLLTLTALAIGISVGTAQADMGLSGSLRLAGWDYDKSDRHGGASTEGFAVPSVWLTLRPQEVEGFRLFVDGFLQNENALRSNRSIGDVREAYVERSLGAFDFKVGRAITVWGRGDKVNPTDSLSVHDYRRLTTDDEEQRTGVVSTQIVYNSGGYRWIGVWLPEWRRNEFPLDRDQGVEYSALRPPHPEEDFALKLDHSGGALDWSVSYYNGYNHNPDLQLLSANSNGVNLGFVNHKINVYGADFASALAGFGVRGEVAYTQTDDSHGDSPLNQNSNWFAVLGADRNLVENFNVNAQAMYRHVQDFHDPSQIQNAGTQTLARQLNVISNQTVADQMGLTLRPSYKLLNETLELEVAYVTWFAKGDSLFRPKVTYAVSDQLKAIVGAEIYAGPSDSYIGRLHEFSSGFAELRFGF